MFTINANHLRGMSKVSIDVDGVTLIAGHNRAGKSSIMQASAAALMGRAIMVAGLKKNEVDRLINSASLKKTATATVSNDEFNCSVSWPSCDVAINGNFKPISDIAAGMVDVTMLDAKTKADRLSELLKTNPTIEDVTEYMAGQGVTEKAIQAAWETVITEGWDAAHAKAKEAGAKRKGAWEQITGARYGSKIAESWTPQGWTDDLEAEDIEALKAKESEKEKEVIEASRRQGADKAERDRLSAAVANLPNMEAKLAEATVKKEEAHKELNEFKLLAIPMVSSPRKCPHCEGLVTVEQNGDLVDASYYDAEKAKKQREDHIKRGKEIEEKFNLAYDVVKELHRAVLSARGLKQQLDDMIVFDGNGNDDLARAKQEHEKAKLALTMKQQIIDARAAHQQVARGQLFIDMLAPDGVRKAKLAKSIEKFNAMLLKISSSFDSCQPVQMSDDLSIYYNGLPLVLVSESEKFRAKVVLQLALAARQKDWIVLIDGADILDEAGRAGLFKMLSKFGMAMVAMTMENTGRLPNNVKKGYWIEDGSSKPYGEKKEAT